MQECEKGPAAVEVGGERHRKSRRRTSAQVQSGSGDPNAGEHRTRDAELYSTGLEIAAERHTNHPESQVRFCSSLFFFLSFSVLFLKLFVRGTN